jgi:ABC-type arginine/histidine transport system permease subunit
LYEATAEFGRAGESATFWLAIIACIIGTILAAYIAFVYPKRNNIPESKRKIYMGIGGIVVLACIALVVFSWISMTLAKRYKGYAALSGVGTFLW